MDKDCNTHIADKPGETDAITAGIIGSDEKKLPRRDHETDGGLSAHADKK